MGGVPPESVLAGDLARFDHFSDGYLAWHPEEAGVIGDLRYGALPQSVEPMWGIRVDQGKVGEHVPFETFREIGEEEREELEGPGVLAEETEADQQPGERPVEVEGSRPVKGAPEREH